MSDANSNHDTEIILSAYAERVRDAFRIFAENLSTGQSEQSCTVRFRRALELMRRTRDLALQAAAGQGPEGTVEDHKFAGAEEAAEPLSEEAQAIIDQALAGTTGHAPAPPPAPRYRSY